MRKKLAVLFGFALTIFVVMSCGGDKAQTASSESAPEPEVSEETATEESPEAEAEEKPTNRRGQLVYKQYCVICHGADGKLAVSGAKDLSISTISLEERISQITNGKGLMTPYKDILSEDQIQSVAEYLEELRQ